MILSQTCNSAHSNSRISLQFALLAVGFVAFLSSLTPQFADAAPRAIAASSIDSWRLKPTKIKSRSGAKYQCYHNSRGKRSIGVMSRKKGKKIFTIISSAPKSKKHRKAFAKATKACRKMDFSQPTPIPTPPPGATPTPFPIPVGCSVPAGFQAVSTEQQIRTSLLSNGNYFLCSNITLSSHPLQMPPLGEKFEGVFDGNGKTIANMVLNNPESVAIGFARTVGRSGVIRNVTFTNAQVSAFSMAGIAAGLNGGTISGVSASGTVTTAAGLAGGLVGVSVRPGQVANRSFNGTVTLAGSTNLVTDNPAVGLEN